MDKRLAYIAIGAIMAMLEIGCSNSKNKNTINIVQSNDTLATTNTNTDVDTESVFAKYDAVKNLTTNWNTAIDKNMPEALNDLYADSVNYYVKTLSKRECIDSKTKWLKEHTAYQQKIEDLEVYYLDDDSTYSLMISRFTKVCIDKTDTTKMKAMLSCIKTTSGWRIVKETDEMTLLNRAKKAAISSLKQGENNFYYGYWMDTRDMQGFGHDQVPYWFSLKLTISENITGEYQEYSGTMRSITSYLVPAGKIENGILEITAVYNENEEMSLETYNSDDVPDARKEKWHFKIINGNELVNLDTPDYRNRESLYLEK